MSQPRNVQFEHIKVDSRQPLGNINTIGQDTQGFLWIATTEGFLRYDGYTCKTFRYDKADSNSLVGNWLNGFSMDSKGNFWLATGFSGVDYFDISTERFTHYSFDPLHPDRIPSQSINYVFVDSKGLVWITTNRGLSQFNPETRVFTLFHHDPHDSTSLGGDNVSVVKEDSKGNIWIGLWGAGLDRFQSKSRSFIHYRKNSLNLHTLSNETVNVILEDQRGILWVGTEGGLNSLDPMTGEFTQYLHDPKNKNTLSNNTVSGIIEDAEGNLWIGTAGGGVNVLDSKRVKWTIYQHDPADPFSVSDNNVAAKYIDHSGNIWFGSRNGTIDKWSPTKQKFSTYRYPDQTSQKFPFNIVWAFMKDSRNRLWVGTQNGILVFDSVMNLQEQYTHDKRVPGSLIFPTVRAILKDRKERIWIGTAQGPELFDERRKMFIPLLQKTKSDYETGDGVNSFYLDSLGTMWMETRSSDILSMREQSIDSWLARRTISSEPIYSRYSIISLSHFTTMKDDEKLNIDDSTQLVWLGRVGGLCRLHTRTMKFESLFLNVAKLSGQKDNRFLTAIQDTNEKNKFWLGTMTGLVEYDISTDEIRYYTERDGLSNNLVYGILSDDEGNLWMSTNNGISKLNLRTKTFRNYSVDQGLQGTEYNRGAYYKLPSGMMLFGGMQGFNYFKPEDIKDNIVVPPIVLTSFQVDDRPYSLPKGVSYMNEIILSWSKNHFSFEFAALDFTNPELNRYSYIMEGYDKQWIDPGTRRFESYTNLDPGEYTFRVKGSNNENFWNEVGTAIKIMILPPYWMTWWFRIGVTFMVILIIIAVYRFRVRRLIEVERLRLRIARDLHDELGSNLSSIALVTDSVRNKFSSKDAEHWQLGESSRVARQMTESIRDIVWFINPENDSLEDLTLKMKTVALTLLAGREHTFTCSEKLSSIKLPLDFKRNLFLIYKEALTNIVRHSHATKVEIIFENEHDTITLTIKDNGKGISESKIHDGIGLENMKKRTELLNGTISFSNGSEQGTKLQVTAKIPRTWYSRYQ